jgi:hypothetical protein
VNPVFLSKVNHFLQKRNIDSSARYHLDHWWATLTVMLEASFSFSSAVQIENKFRLMAYRLPETDVSSLFLKSFSKIS